MKKGFTLVELSIVLVIIGLLIGGILVGQSLVQNAKLKRVVTDIQQYRILYNQFIDIYMFKPGDVPASKGFFGSTESYGNGDDDLYGDGYPYREAHLFWRHLSLAGLLNTEYYCASSTGNCLHSGDANHVFRHNWGISEDFAAGKTVPEAPLGDSVYYIQDNTQAPSTFTFRELGIGLSQAGSGAILYPSDAYYLDKKLDDGLPGDGEVHTRHRSCSGITSSTSCFTNWVSGCSPTPSTSAYLPANDNENCLIYFELGEI